MVFNEREFAVVAVVVIDYNRVPVVQSQIATSMVGRLSSVNEK